jgi:hypothetical protein
MHEIHEMHAANLVIGAGLVLVLAGIILVLHQTMNWQRGKRGRLHTKFNLRRWSFQSIFVATMLIAVGALLVGGGHLMGDH